MTQAVAILVPVLGRPDNVKPLMRTVAANTPRAHRLLFIATDTDQPELDALNRAGADYITIDEPGTYARKINAGARATLEPLVFMAADDLRFHPGWLEHATKMLAPGVEVVGTNDLGNTRTIHGEHSTHTLVTRAYIDKPGGVIDGEPGLVLCEQYPHEYCDDEFIETAKARAVYAHAYQSHVEHLHYAWTDNYGEPKGHVDDTYLLGRKSSRLSRGIFRTRRHLWRPRQPGRRR